MMDLRKKRCSNCGRFPFCEYQLTCYYCDHEAIKTQNENHWVKREVATINVQSKSI